MLNDLNPYPAYKDSKLPWLGSIPSHWDVRRNGRLFAQRNETGFAELPILEVSLKTGVKVRDMDAGRKQVMADRDAYKRAAKGDIAYNMMRMWQGAVGVAPADGLVSPAYVVASPSPDVEPRDYSYLFRTAAYMDEVDKFSRGIVKDRNRLYWDQFKQMPSVCPPEVEQRQISDFLDSNAVAVRRLVRNKRRLIEILNEQKQAIIVQAVTRGLDPNVKLKPSGIEWMGDVPKHWSVLQIGRFATVGNGSTPSRGSLAYWAGGNYPWLNSSTVNAGTISKADQFVTEVALRECHLPRVPPGSVLVAITGQGKTRGTSAVLMFEATINQHLAFICPKPEGVTTGPEYLRTLLLASYPELRRISDSSGSTKGALTCGDLRHFKVALPPVSEQVHILAMLEKETASVVAAITAAEREVRLVHEYRARLIDDVVMGKTDVRHMALIKSDVDVTSLEPLDADFDSESDDLQDVTPGEVEVAHQ